VEERRQGLEEYLQGIVSARDSRWRDSPPWRTFLNLPVLKRDDLRTRRTQEEDWLEIHKQAKILLQDARQHLSRRTTAPTIKDQHSASAAAKRCLVLAGTKVTLLQNGLSTLEVTFNTGIGEGEIRRRRDLIRELNTEILGLERLSQSLATQRTTLSISNATEQQNPLFTRPVTGTPPSRRVFGAPPETERTKGLDNVGVLQLQQTIMKEQDDQLDDFLRQMRRTKDVASQIGEELDSQADLLNGLDDDVERFEGKLKRADRQARKII
jgi:regulator of vacuolar morphogenesis